jgi:hypothetical protein
MSTLAEHLNDLQADTDTVVHAGREYVVRQSGLKSSDQMLAELAKELGDRQKVDQALADLGKDPVALEEIYLLCLSVGWEDSKTQTDVKAAVDGAKEKLPVVETAIIAATAAFGLYLLAKEGFMKEKGRRTIHRADGSFEVVEIAKYHSPSDVFRGLLSLFGKSS